MRHLIVGQVGIKIITSITGGEESNLLYRICLNQDGRASSANKISLTNLPILLLTLINVRFREHSALHRLQRLKVYNIMLSTISLFTTSRQSPLSITIIYKVHSCEKSNIIPFGYLS